MWACHLVLDLSLFIPRSLSIFYEISIYPDIFTNKMHAFNIQLNFFYTSSYPLVYGSWLDFQSNVMNFTKYLSRFVGLCSYYGSLHQLKYLRKNWGYQQKPC